MHPSIPLLVISLIYTILVLSLFFTKGKIITVENKIYTWLLFVVIIGIILDIMGIYCHLYLPDTSFIRWLVVKFYLAYLLIFVFLITLYMISISYKEKMKFIIDKKSKMSNIVKILVLVLVISLILNFILTFTYHKEGTAVYLFGSNTLFVYGMAALGIISWIALVLKNKKRIPTIKVVPIIIFCLICVPVILLQLSNPEILVVTSLTAFLVNFMYHTIENPDKTMLNELYRNKELVEQTYEDKSNFLFEITGEVRNPLFNISNICKNISSSDDIEEIKTNIKEINNYVKQLDFVVNDVLNVNNLDVQKIRFIDNRYNVNYLYNEIVNKTNSFIDSNNVEFRTSITHNIPYLYGDSIKIKQIIMSILLNSVKKTKKGFIEFNIDTIERYDVCRLIITIKDSGTGISLDKINEILSSTGELDTEDIKDMEKTELNIKLCQKITKLMGGSLMIKSEENKGTEVMLTFNQRIVLSDKNTYLEKYENFVSTNKKALLVCQDKEISKNIKIKLIDNNINVSHLLNGLDAVDKIKSGKKYDFILIEDDMKEMSGYTTLKELKKLDKFNIPVIIMLKDNKLSIKEEYIKDGFKDYILLNNISVELDRIIDKY